MKIKTLLLGSVAAAGLSSAAFAADMPKAMTSLDVCDSLGLSGLTISSDSNCLQISGSVEYKFTWGDYKVDDSRSVAFLGFFDSEYGVHNNNTNYTVDYGNGLTNWESKLETHLNVVATSESDFGPAAAHIMLKQKTDISVYSDGADSEQTSSKDTNVTVDKAWVQVGDSTILMAGKKDSVANLGDDTPFNDFLGMFNSQEVNSGVSWDNGAPQTGAFWSNASGPTEIRTGGYSIQVVSDLGNGVSVKAGLENLDGSEGKLSSPWGQQGGTFIGVMEYAGDNLTAHATLAVGNVLSNSSGYDKTWAVHAGATATMDNFKLRGAIAANSNNWWNGMVTGEATFDMFTLAASAEATSDNEWGAGGQVTAKLTDTVKLNVGGRYFNFDTNTSNLDGWEVAAGLTADISDSLTLSGKIGYLGRGSAFPLGLGFGPNGHAIVPSGTNAITYGEIAASWTPAKDFTASVTGDMNSESAYKITFDAKKTFQ